MLKNNRIFRSICLIYATLLTLAGLFPLATMAFGPQSVVETRDEDLSIPQPPETAFTTIAHDNTINAGDDKLPVYDTFTVAERKKAGLPTLLHKPDPLYGEKIVYLTFDDGPDPDNTSAILKILGEQNIKATFFIVGSETEKYPQLLLQIFNAGHAVGNHTYNHIYRELYHSAAVYTAQLNHTDEIVKKIIGVRPVITRAPGGTAGNFTPQYREALKQQGYYTIDWNISSGDASRSKAPQLTANILRQVETNKYLWSHAIVLMHDGRGHEETVKALPDIIKIFKDRGFEFRAINLNTPPAW